MVSNDSQDESSEQVISKKPESYIKGTTLEVYYYLLKKRDPAGVREIQRALNLSSPSVSAYHLEKLCGLKVVRKTSTGDYEVSQKINAGILDQFVLVGSYALPRFLFYALFYSFFFIGYLLFFFKFPLTTSRFFNLLFGTISLIIFWFETIISWKKRPF